MVQMMMLPRHEQTSILQASPLSICAQQWNWLAYPQKSAKDSQNLVAVRAEVLSDDITADDAAHSSRMLTMKLFPLSSKE